MDFTLVQELREADIFKAASKSDQKKRELLRLEKEAARVEELARGLTVTSPVKIRIKGYVYERYLLLGGQQQFNRTYKGRLNKVLATILDRHFYGCEEDEFLATKKPGDLLGSFISAVEGTNGDGCDYVTLIELVAPKAVILFQGDTEIEDEVDVGESRNLREDVFQPPTRQDLARRTGELKKRRGDWDSYPDLYPVTTKEDFIRAVEGTTLVSEISLALFNESVSNDWPEVLFRRIYFDEKMNIWYDNRDGRHIILVPSSGLLLTFPLPQGVK
jgi:hypothetical protein